jgi:hypothetical protein
MSASTLVALYLVSATAAASAQAAGPPIVPINQAAPAPANPIPSAQSSATTAAPARSRAHAPELSAHTSWVADEGQALTPDLAFADTSDPDPGSGIAMIIAGWVGATAAIAGGLQLPICSHLDYEGPFTAQSCRRYAIGATVSGLAVGVPFLVFGYKKRKRQRAWRERHGLGFLQPHLAAAALHGGGALLSYAFRL